MANQTAPEPCPTCGGDMYDNSQSKRNPRAPDYVCKDPTCLTESGQRTGIWISDTMRNARAGAQQPRQQQGQRRQGPPPTGPQRAIVLDALYFRCLEAARNNIAANVAMPNGYSDQGVVAIATALFHARLRGGLLKAEKLALEEAAKPKPKPQPRPAPAPAPQQRPPENFEDWPTALDEAEDELPF